MVHIPGRELAKTVILKVDGKLAMAVMSASRQVNLVKLRAALDALDVEVAHEHDFMDRFPDCELGAMPPFGILYDLPLYVDESLTRDYEIAFNAGSHRELIRMAYKDFAAVAKPVVLDFATLPAVHAHVA
jgi:Ala-tRNA(Pro) deacylase